MRWWRSALVIVAAAGSAFNLFAMTVGHMMNPRWGSAGDNVVLTAFCAVVVLTAGGLVVATRRSRMAWGVVALILAAGFAPLIYEAQWRSGIQAEHLESVRAME